MSLKQVILSIYHEFPVGMSHEEHHKFYEDEIRSVIRMLYARPEWLFCHYMCGETMQWLQDYHPEVLSALSQLALRKQNEPLGGAFYAALLPLIAVPDRTAQMVEMALALRSHFGKKPRGAHLHLGVWESSLAHTLKSGDLEYTIVPRALFIANGESAPGELYLTEEMGKTLMLFPGYELNLEIDPEHEALNVLALACEGDGVLALTTNASNVTHLEKILHHLHTAGIQFTLPYKHIKPKTQAQPLKRIYLSAAHISNVPSFTSFYRNELFNQVELQLFHAKSLHTAVAVRQIKKDKSRKNEALQALLKAQNHQFYWQSRFGGLFQASARHLATRYLLEADAIAREAGVVSFGLIRADFDMDGVEEALFHSIAMNAFVHNCGGVLFTLDHIPTTFSFLNVLDTHHCSSAARAFHDLVFKPTFSYEQWRGSWQDVECAGFNSTFYEGVQVKTGNKEVQYHAARHFEDTLLSLDKNYRFHTSGVSVTYYLKNDALGVIDHYFAIEINLSLAVDTLFSINNGVPSEERMFNEVKGLEMFSSKQCYTLALRFSQAVQVWIKQLYGTANEQEHHQGYAILLLLPLQLSPTEESTLAVDLDVGVLNV